MTSFHSLRCWRHRTDFQGYVPLHTVREWKTAFQSSRWRCPINALKRIIRMNLHLAFFCHGRERNIHLFRRRESNSDRWIRRRTVSHCASRPRHKTVLSINKFVVSQPIKCKCFLHRLTQPTKLNSLKGLQNETKDVMGTCKMNKNKTGIDQFQNCCKTWAFSAFFFCPIVLLPVPFPATSSCW